MAKETFTFQAEVGKILDIVAHSLYSEKEVFFILEGGRRFVCKKRKSGAIFCLNLIGFIESIVFVF